MKSIFNQPVKEIIRTSESEIFCFDTRTENIDHSVVDSFGEEWNKFNSIADSDITQFGDEYFDIIDDRMVNKKTYAIDIGCGTGRFTKYLLDRVGFIEALDPSASIYAADKLLKDKKNVRLSKAATDNIPFDDETFDFGMSIGVLHHIPNTQKAMSDCVKKIKIGGYFYTYLYYNLENRSRIFRSVFFLSSIIRRSVSKMPAQAKKIVCDILAIVIYMPFILAGRFLNLIKLKKLAMQLPLSYYQDKTFFIIRNDSLDRFGTSLEHRFSKTEVKEMMEKSGLVDIVISDNMPYWHSVGRRAK